MNWSYESFAVEPEYLEVNRRFIESIPLLDVNSVLDLACGTGTLSVLMIERLAATRQGQRIYGPQETIIGIDVSLESLELAQREVKRFWRANPTPVNFVQATVENLPVATASFDLVVIGNAIQLFDNKEMVVRDVHRMLRSNGIFAFNTSFYAGTFVSGTEGFYLKWVEEAFRYVADQTRRSDQNEHRRRRRSREHSIPAFSRPWLSRGEYKELLTRNGFLIQDVAEREVLLTEHSFRSIGSYGGLASVLLSGYPTELACEALEKSVGRALAGVRMKAIPRKWIEFVMIRE
jgi:ubiquinone/menaquinone biosynthesis C-methylase UbiE